MNESKISRRGVLQSAALAGSAVAATLAAPTLALAQYKAKNVTRPEKEKAPPETRQPQTPKMSAVASDLAILNFALGLEHLEAAFYSQVLGAHGQRAYLINQMPQVAREIAANENSHVQTLQSAITAVGGTPVGPQVYKFPNNVFVSPVAFAWFGYTLEEIGIGAYLGAVGQIKSAPLRRAAASIYGAETRHAAVLRAAGGWNFAPRYFESPLSVAQVQALIAPYVS